jgi:hypothetical protein
MGAIVRETLGRVWKKRSYVLNSWEMIGDSPGIEIVDTLSDFLTHSKGQIRESHTGEEVDN